MKKLTKILMNVVYSHVKCKFVRIGEKNYIFASFLIKKKNLNSLNIKKNILPTMNYSVHFI